MARLCGYEMRGTQVLDGHQFQCRLDNVLGADFEFLDQLPGRAGVTESVFDANGSGDEGDAVKLVAGGENGADASGKCANLMLLSGDDRAGFARGANDRLGESMGLSVCILRMRVS